MNRQLPRRATRVPKAPKAPKAPPQPPERLSRFLAGAGVASRRHVDELIEQGRVLVNGEKAELGQRIVPGVDKVVVDGLAIAAKESKTYIALNKPFGYLSTCSDPFDRKTVLSLLPDLKERVFPVGRLDLDADGLLLLTNDGDLAYLLTHPKHHVVKEYLVEVVGDSIETKTKTLASGIILDGKKVEVDYVRFFERPPRLLIGVHEGEKHLVKNLCRAVGLQVRRLSRVKMGPLLLGRLPSGKWRYLEDKEVAALYEEGRRALEGEHHGER